MTTPAVLDPNATTRKTWLPAVGTWKYHLMLLSIGILILGPLGGVTASYMNFSLGFFVGGQVLAGILGSSVTYGYGAEGKHGANYMQTAAASVAGMSGMAVLVQAMVWLGLPQPPAWQLVLYLMCIGMFGVGVGMLYTPILVDRLQLTFPSGLAVANILRALTDKRLLKQSIAKLGGGAALGVGGGLAATFVPILGAIELSTSTLGAGMIVGARIGIPAILGGLVSVALKPYFVSIGWLAADQPFRKITFLIALGMIMGAAIVDLAIIFWKAAKRVREKTSAPSGPAPEVEDWKRTSTGRLIAWVVFWGTGIAIVGSYILHVPIGFLLFAIALVFLFAMVNGISLGISDSNPISSAFVVTVVLMGALGLRDAGVGLMAGSILLVSTSVACDMQQDRSTGWRLGTNRILQFRYQVAGITVGALLAVAFAKIFMQAYPDLTLDQTVLTEAQQPKQWGAAMTYKFVGALRSLTQDATHLRTAIWVGVGIGFATELLRKIVKSLAGYKKFVESGRAGFATDFVVDAIILPSPYASSFGGFVNLPTSLWFGGGGIFSSALNTLTKKTPAPAGTEVKKEAPAEGGEDLPEDMSTTSLVGGGLLAGDSLAALALGIFGLLSTIFGGH